MHSGGPSGVDGLRRRGIKAAIVGPESTAAELKDIRLSRFNLVFGSPEALLHSHRTFIRELKDSIKAMDQFLYLVNRARLGFTEHEYLFVHETQPRSRYRARGGRHRAPQPSSSTSKSWYLEENNYIELHNIPSRMTFELSSYKGMHACRGGKLTSIELENPRPLLLW